MIRTIYKKVDIIDEDDNSFDVVALGAVYGNIAEDHTDPGVNFTNGIGSGVFVLNS